MNRRWLVSLTMGFLLVAPAAAPSSAAELEGDAEGVRLSLGEALRTALENNLDLVIARKDPKIAEQGIIAEEAAFDSALTASGSFDRSSTETTFVNVGAVDKSNLTNWTGSVGWGQKVTFGAEYGLTFNTGERDPSSVVYVNQQTGFLQRDDNLFTNDSFGFSYKMPLLRGFGKTVNTANLVLARSGLDISRWDLSRNAQSVVKQVEDAYWDLLATRAALDVARESLKLAQDLLQLNRKKVEVGTLAPIEVTQAEAGVASREEGVILAETAVQNAEDNLRRLLAIPSDDPAWSRRIVPTDKPVFEPRTVDLPATIGRALDGRPEILAARQDVRDSELRERVASNGVRHDLQLEASVGRGDGDQELAIEILDPPGRPLTSSNTSDRTDNWSIGLNYTLPIGNRAAKAQYAVATLNREKAETALRNVEQTIRVDVRTAGRNVESGVKRVQAARSSTVLQRKTLEAEQKKFDNGMSTSFEVLRIQTDLSNAQLAEIRAMLDYMKSQADLERAQGTLLEARGLQLAE